MLRKNMLTNLENKELSNRVNISSNSVGVKI